MKREKNYDEWYSIVCPIITSEEFLRRKTFRHHGDKTVYDHSIKVSKKAYDIAKKLHCDYRSAAIAGVLHDLYSTPWQDVKIKQPLFKMHAFTHAKDALMNARKYFPEYLNDEIEDAILRHMFPLNITPPKHKIGYILTIADKMASMDMLTSSEAMRKMATAVIFTFIGRG